MPIGNRPSRGRGFTYLGLLLLLALQGAALAALGRQVSTQVQREREAELRFRGAQIAAAIGRYRAAQQPPQYPASLAELLADERGPQVLHHLRRLYPDPFTGRPDWVPVADESTGRLKGVRSSASTRRWALLGAEPGPAGPTVGDWVFIHEEKPTAAAPAAPAASAVMEGTR